METRRTRDDVLPVDISRSNEKRAGKSPSGEGLIPKTIEVACSLGPEARGRGRARTGSNFFRQDER